MTKRELNEHEEKIMALSDFFMKKFSDEGIKSVLIIGAGPDGQAFLSTIGDKPILGQLIHAAITSDPWLLIGACMGAAQPEATNIYHREDRPVNAEHECHEC